MIKLALVILCISVSSVVLGVGSVNRWIPHPKYPGMCYMETTVSSLWKIDGSFMGNGSNPSMVIFQRCCPGYKEYDHDKNKCIPDCGNKCRNGFCTQPGVCECFPGFVKSLAGECVSGCPYGCLNGKCHASGICQCNQGYTHIDNEKLLCVPICQNGCGWNENCTAPGRCECLNGYSINPTRINSRCEPICNPHCGHGDCIGPGKCACFAGYKLIDGVCQANCTRGCENGRCDLNDNCICDEGWYLSRNQDKCLPYCSSGCANGFCKKPEMCECNPGYQLVDGRCKPVCIPNCGPHGRCIRPDECQCDYPYIWNNIQRICIERMSDIMTVPSKTLFDEPSTNRPMAPPYRSDPNSILTHSSAAKDLPPPPADPYIDFKYEQQIDSVPHQSERYYPQLRINTDHGGQRNIEQIKCPDNYLRLGSECVPLCNAGEKRPNNELCFPIS